MLFGWLVVYAVQFGPQSSSLFNFSGIHGRQLIWIIISLIMGMMILIFDSEFFPGFAWIIYGLVMALVLFVMLTAREINGARAWLEFGSIKIQPSEFAKYATALALAKYLSMPSVNLAEWRSRAGALAVIGLPMLLIIGQKDTGSALVFTSFIFVLYREGFPIGAVVVGAYLAILGVLSLLVEPGYLHSAVALLCLGYAVFALQRSLKKNRQPTLNVLILLMIGMVVLIITGLLTESLWLSVLLAAVFMAVLYFFSQFLRRERRYILLPAGLFLLSLFFGFFIMDVAFNDVLEAHQRERILTLVGKNSDKDANYNVDQSKMTIASGGWLGKGYLQGTLTRYGHVPEQQTDFIFCTIGEEFGFVGSAAFLLAYLALLIRIVLLAERQRSAFSRSFAYGVAALFFVQIAINVGMTIGLVPVIGIPLPFVSYGGSSILAFSVLIFTMLRLDADRLLVLR